MEKKTRREFEFWKFYWTLCKIQWSKIQKISIFKIFIILVKNFNEKIFVTLVEDLSQILWPKFDGFWWIFPSLWPKWQKFSNFEKKKFLTSVVKNLISLWSNKFLTKTKKSKIGKFVWPKPVGYKLCHQRWMLQKNKKTLTRVAHWRKNT